MRHTCKLLYTALLLLCLSGFSAHAQTTTSFGYTGAVQYFTVPSGVFSVSVQCWGGQGGNANDVLSTSHIGGDGGYASGNLAVTPGEVLFVYVGGKGSTTGATGWNGGGPGGLSSAGGGCSGGYAGSGGDASDIRQSGTTLAFRVVVGAGGGGSGRDYCNGSCVPCGCGGSGGPDDMNGHYAFDCGYGYAGTGVNFGAKGTLVGGGAPGPNDGGGTSSTGGVLGIGGTGAPGSYDVSGGGGGGGYYGGGGGGAAGSGSGVGGGGGGGGSNYVGGLTATSSIDSVTVGNGEVNITVECTAGPISGSTTLCISDTTTFIATIGGGTWSSMGGISLATVGTNAFVTGVSAGTGIVTYSVSLLCGSVYTTAVVTVNPPPVPIAGTLSLCVGKTTALTEPLAGTWTSSALPVATVSGTGVVSGVSAGTATITYADGGPGCITTAVVTVNPNPAITGTMHVCVGLTTPLTGSIPGGTWSSSALGVATVGTTGVVTGAGAGTAVITYTLSTGCLSTVHVTVNPNPAAIAGSTGVCVGQIITLTDGGGGTWSSSNTAVGTVGLASGVVTGMAPGSTVITYTLATGCIATTTVGVLFGAVPITGPTAVCQGQTITAINTTGGGTWSSGNVAIAVIGSGNAHLTGVLTGSSAAGTAIITYTVGTGCFVTEVVTVNPLPAPIMGADNICRFLSTTLTDATPGGIWTSDFPTIASVGSNTGVVTGVAPSGGTPIRYTLPTGCQTLTPLYMNVHIAPSGLPFYTEFCQGSTMTVSVAYPVGGTWSSSNTAVATVTDLGYPFGRISGVSGGTAIISYNIVSCPSNTDTVTIDPLPAPIDGLTSICIGRPVSLYDSTAGGTWSSSDTTVAVIDSVTGVITCRTLTLGLSTLITYELPTTCLVTALVTTNAAPDTISGPDTVCQGGVATLSDATSGGIWSSTSLATAQIIDTSGVLTGVRAGSVVISYTMPSGCYAAYPFRVSPPIPAIVTISEYPDTMICAGSLLQFVASTTNAGIPTFQWQLFYGSIPDSTRDTLFFRPIHGDVIVCQVVTHGVCSLRDTVYDTIATNVYPNPVSPSISIMTSDTFNFVNDSTHTLWYPGQVIDMYSNVVFGGSNQTFQWYRNRQLILGATSSSYSTAVYANDTFTCMVTGNPPCDPGPMSAMSNHIIILGNYLNVPGVGQAGDLSLYPNPNNGGFTLSGAVKAEPGETVTLEVSDILGHVVYRGTANAANGNVNQQIVLDGVANGSYLLKVNSSADSEVFHFIVSR